jgi:hypothetical protein
MWNLDSGMPLNYCRPHFIPCHRSSTSSGNWAEYLITLLKPAQIWNENIKGIILNYAKENNLEKARIKALDSYIGITTDNTLYSLMISDLTIY